MDILEKGNAADIIDDYVDVDIDVDFEPYSVQPLNDSFDEPRMSLSSNSLSQDILVTNGFFRRALSTPHLSALGEVLPQQTTFTSSKISMMSHISTNNNANSNCILTLNLSTKHQLNNDELIISPSSTTTTTTTTISSKTLSRAKSMPNFAY